MNNLITHHRLTEQQSTKAIIKIRENFKIDVLSCSKKGSVSQSFSHLTSKTNKLFGELLQETCKW